MLQCPLMGMIVFYYKTRELEKGWTGKDVVLCTSMVIRSHEMLLDLAVFMPNDYPHHSAQIVFVDVAPYCNNFDKRDCWVYPWEYYKPFKATEIN